MNRIVHFRRCDSIPNHVLGYCKIFIEYTLIPDIAESYRKAHSGNAVAGSPYAEAIALAPAALAQFHP